MTAASRTTAHLPLAHQSAAPWLTRLGPGQVLSLPAQGGPRWLQVEQGCLWVTAARQSGPCVPAEADIWLQAGESLPMAAHSAWVVQAWPSAQVLIAQAAPTGARGPAQARLFSGWRMLLAAVLRRVRTSPQRVACA